jgi:ABC-2 type transport system permease protein
MLRPILTLITTDLLRVTKEKSSLFWILAMPILLVWILGNVFRDPGGTETPPTISIADEDSTFLSGVLRNEVEAEGVRVVDPGNGVSRLTLPGGFEAKLLAGERDTLELVITEARENYRTNFALYRAIFGFLTKMARAPEGGLTADVYDSLAGETPRVGLEIGTAGKPHPGGSLQAVLGMTVQAILMMVVVYGAVFLTEERMNGMLRRQTAYPAGLTGLVIGKVGGRACIGAIQMVIVLTVGSMLFTLPRPSSGAAFVLLGASYILAVASLATLAGTLFRSADRAGGFSWPVTLMLSALGGCWWPLEVVGPWLRIAGHLSPAAWAMDGLNQVFHFGRGIGSVLLPSAVLLGMGLALSLVARHRLAKLQTAAG